MKNKTGAIYKHPRNKLAIIKKVFLLTLIVEVGFLSFATVKYIQSSNSDIHRYGRETVPISMSINEVVESSVNLTSFKKCEIHFYLDITCPEYTVEEQAHGTVYSPLYNYPFSIELTDKTGKVIIKMKPTESAISYRQFATPFQQSIDYNSNTDSIRLRFNAMGCSMIDISEVTDLSEIILLARINEDQIHNSTLNKTKIVIRSFDPGYKLKRFVYITRLISIALTISGIGFIVTSVKQRKNQGNK